jgi:serpin B
VGTDGTCFRLNIVNALWGQTGSGFLTEYLAVLDAHFGAGLRQVDFAAAPEDARHEVNKWVSDQTEERIQDLIPAGLLTPLTRLVLTNAVYFNAAWALPFSDRLTEEGVFHLSDGSPVPVQMMHLTDSLGYVEGEGFVAVDLPYEGRQLSMLAIVPAPGQFDEVEARLSQETVDRMMRALEPVQLALALPKWAFESSFGLGETLSIMGMPAAFGSSADFSGMSGHRNLYISEVLHKAYVEVDEAGTEAAAATAVVMRRSAIPAGPPVEVVVDRPFVFVIRDTGTGTILFIGRVMDPRG